MAAMNYLFLLLNFREIDRRMRNNKIANTTEKRIHMCGVFTE